MKRYLVLTLVVVGCSSSSGSADGTGDGGSPSSGAACAESFAEVVASQKLAPDAAIFRQIIVDGATIFARTDDQIFAVAGGALTPLFGQLGSDATKADAMWIDAQTIWFQSGNSFQSIPKAGGAPATTIGQDATKGAQIIASAHDTDGFYYIRQLLGSAQPYTIASLSAAGAQKDLQPIGDKTAKQIFVDGAFLYWFQGDTGQTALYRMSKSGGPPQKIADADPGFSSIGSASGGGAAFDETYVYFSSVPDAALQRHLMRAAKDGSGPPQQVGDFGGDVLTAQGGSVWGVGVITASPSQIGPAVWRAGNGSTVALACLNDGRTMHALAVDGANAYVAITNGDANASGIYKVAR